jgi:hypothetical protein
MKKIDIEIAIAEGLRVLFEKPAILIPSFLSTLLWSYLTIYALKFKNLDIEQPIPAEILADAILFFEIFVVVILLSIYFDSVIIRLSYTKASLIDALTYTAGRYPYILASSLIYGLIMVLGAIALLIPGMYLAVRLYYFMYAIIIDEEGIVSSLKKSWEIARGNWWRTFAIMLLLTLLAVFIESMLSSIAMFVSMDQRYVSIALQTPATAIIRAWSYSAFVVAYLQIKGREDIIY